MLGRLDHAEQIRVDSIGAGDVAYLLSPDAEAVVQRDGGERGGPTVALVGLVNTRETAPRSAA